MSFKHFNIEKRKLLEKLLEEDCSKQRAAQLLGISRSAIYQEIQVNGSKSGKYCAEKAHYKASLRRRQASRRKRKQYDKIVEYIKEKLQLYWSPEQISGRIVQDLKDVTISFKTIYRWLLEGSYVKHGTIFTGYAKFLRIKGPGKRLRHYISKARSAKKDLPPIENRKDDKKVGHWECDLVQGHNRSGYLLTFVERRSGFTFIEHCEKKSILNLNKALGTICSMLPSKYLKSIAFDRGKEFYGYKEIEDTFGVSCYFCNPSSPQERGLNENTNGLIRQFFPKKRDFSTIEKGEINRAMNLLNNRPKKRFGYKTTVEVLKSLRVKLLYRFS